MGKSMRWIAAKFKVDPSTVWLWSQRAQGMRLDRVDFSDRKRGRAWNRTGSAIEQRIVELRASLRESSVLGEYGAAAIHQALKKELPDAPTRATINRVLARRGLHDGVRRVRRPAPPAGWYLPDVAAGRAEIDCFDFIEGLKIAQGPLLDVLTAKSLHGRLTDAWTMNGRSARETVRCLRSRWKSEGLPRYAQFDNDTVFQGAHQFADAVGRVSRLCLQLGVVPVFVPPLEHGMQNTIEGFNALWQAKVWRRHRVGSARELQQRSDRYIAAHRLRSRANTEGALPPRTPMPKCFRFHLHAPLRGLMVFIRRTDDTGHAHLLGQRFPVSPHWTHRLVRCEVDFDHHHIRCFALRRLPSTEQPLLATIPYHCTEKPFRGKK